MTEKLTPIEILKSKQNFSNFMADTPAFIISTLADYPQANGKVILEVAELTQNIETFNNLLADPMVENFEQPPFLVWTVTNPKEKIIQELKTLNKFGTKGFGIFVFKAFLKDDKIEFECVLKPELSATNLAKEIQYQYWKEFNKIVINRKLGYSIKPQSKHWQYISSGKRRSSFMLVANTQDKCIGIDLIISKDKTIYDNLYKFKKEIEEQLGDLEWVNKERNKTCKVRKILNCDISDTSKHLEIIEKHIELIRDFKTTLTKYMD